MAHNQYCIVDNTIDPTVALEGLTGLTDTEAYQWLNTNQVDLEAPIEVNGFTYTTKYSQQRDNWVPEIED
jgi:hypothetical protein